MNKNIDYFSIIKKAIDVTKKNKTLWWFGLLSIFAGSGTSFNYNFSDSSSSEKEFSEMEYASLLRKISFYWENYTEWIILGIIVLVVIFVGLYLVGLIGNGALIDSILKVIKNEKITFRSGFKRGVFFLKKIFLLNMLFFFSFLVFIFILVFPVIRLFILESYGAAIFLGMVAFFLLIFVAVLVFYLKKYAQLYLIGGDLGVIESIKLAYRLLEKNIKESLIMGLVMMVVGLILGLGIILVAMLIFIPGGLIGLAVHDLMSKATITGLVLMFWILIIVLFILISAVLNVFYQTSWILFFDQIAKQELPEEKVVAQEKTPKIIKEPGIEPNV